MVNKSVFWILKWYRSLILLTKFRPCSLLLSSFDAQILFWMVKSWKLPIWMTRYHSDSLSLWFVVPPVVNSQPWEPLVQRPAKGTGARLQEADAMNNPWVRGPSDYQRLVEGKNAGTMATMFFDCSLSGFPADMKPILGKQTCDSSNRKHVKTTRIQFGLI